MDKQIEKKMGRPPKAEEDKLSETVGFRVTMYEKQTLGSIAKGLNMPDESAFFRAIINALGSELMKNNR